MRRRILIVEDDADLQRAMLVRLQAAGYETLLAGDVLGAVRQAGSSHPDLVLLDLGLPAGGGFGFLERLRNMGLIERIPVVVVSAWDPEIHEARALAAGAVAYLHKPVAAETLLRTIEQHLPERAAVQAGSRGRILLIEDDADLRLALLVRFEASGFETMYAADATTALTQATRHRPQVVLLDLGLPGGDGFQVLDRLKRHPQLAGVPVIVVSGRDPEANRPRALAGGAVAFFQKPADPKALLQAVADAMAGSTGEP